MAVVAIIPLFILLLLVVGLILGIAFWATSGGGGSGEMACGRCGYQVRGLEQLSCPECGTDLREAGIRPGGRPGRRVWGMVLTFGCGGLLSLGCLLSALTFVGYQKSPTVIQPNQTMPPSSVAQPAPTDPPAADETPAVEDESGTEQTP